MEQKTIKKKKKFTNTNNNNNTKPSLIKAFRKNLRGDNFIKDVQNFLHRAYNEKDCKIFKNYIDKNGDPTEISQALQRVEKTDLTNLFYVCDLLQLVLMEILTNFKDHTAAAVRASRHIVKYHISVLNSLLESSDLKHRKCALKILIAIVCAEPLLAGQIISSFDILSDAQSIRKFLSHSISDMDTGEETVRKCFIHFILSFLIEGNIILIRCILERVTLIKELIFGLTYDDHVTVCVVLSTLKQYVLENMEIKKTMKFHVFNEESIKYLLNLYEWRGPSCFVAKCKKNDGAFLSYHEFLNSNLINPKERDAVSEVVHDFLLVLLTSRKYGINFNIKYNKTNSIKQKRNVLQSKALNSIAKPWLNDRKSELVIRTLKACPEIARSTILYFSKSINSERVYSKEWAEAYTFMENLISNLHPIRLKHLIKNTTLTEYEYLIKDICLPIDILTQIRTNKSLKSNDYTIRYAANRLLLAMFKQYSCYMDEIKKLNDVKNGINTLRRFKFNLLNYILIQFPTIDDILSSLHESIAYEQTNPEIDICDHLELTLDLLLIICKEHRSFINKTSAILDFLQLLRPLYTSTFTAISEENDQSSMVVDNRNVVIELKAIKTILLISPKTLEPGQPLFENSVQSFVRAFVYGFGEVKHEAGLILREIFLNTEIFETSELEIDIWLEALRFFDNETIKIVVKVIIECFRVKNAKINIPADAIDDDSSPPNKKKCLHELFENIEKGLTVQGYVKPITISKLMPLILTGVVIVKPLEIYLQSVYILMFHYFPIPQAVQQIGATVFPSCNDYINGWLSKQQSDLDMKCPTVIPFLADIYHAILNGKMKFEEIFKISNSENEQFHMIELNGKEIQMNVILSNERVVTFYIQEIIFLIAQLAHKKQLTEMQTKSASNFMINFLNIINTLSSSSDNNKNDTEIIAKIFINFSPSSISYFGKVLEYIFKNRLNFIHSSNLFNIDSTHLNLMQFLLDIINCCAKYQLENFSDLTNLFQMKIVKAIEISSLLSVEKMKKKSDLLETTIRVIEAIQLSMETCLEILKLLYNLNYTDLFQSETGKKTIYMDLLQIIFNRLSQIKKSVICEEFFGKFSSIYIDLITKSDAADVNVEQLEESLYKFLLVSHQNICHLTTDVFCSIFKANKIHKSTIKLACLLFDRDPKLRNISIDLIIRENYLHKELIYPILNVAINNQYEFDNNLLENIYQECKNGIMKSIEKPLKAGVIYKENIKSSICLIEKCMPSEECVNLCEKVFKFDTIEIYQFKIIEAIFRKAIKSIEDQSDVKYQTIFIQYINLCVEMFIVILKRNSFDEEKISILAYSIFKWWPKLTPSQLDSKMLEKIRNSTNWMQFCKICLKTGMFLDECEVFASETNIADDRRNGKILKILAFLCNKIYDDVKDDGNDQAGQLYEMIFAHSKFLDIVTNDQLIDVKTGVMHLLLILARKSNLSAMNAKQIPIILAAYQAKLFATDRYTLALLQVYENRGIDLQKFRPFIWGESAISFYSLHSDDIEKTNLNYQETSVGQIMSLIDSHISEYTIENFPHWRKLNPGLQLPAVEFDDPDFKHLDFGSNPLERKIENGVKEFLLSDLRNCPKSEDFYNECYDPAFILPLMAMCFAPEMYSHPVRPVQNGLLAIVFAALSSQDKDMRLAAGLVHQRYRLHFENKIFLEKDFWTQMYDNVQAGLNNLRQSWLKENSKNTGIPRASYIPTLFIAKAVNITMHPLDILYKQLTNYVCVRMAFDFQLIPDFNVLFYSSEVQHNKFRHYILSIIRNGIKTSSDLYLILATHTFKVLMAFYGCTISTLEINLLILSIFSTCAKIPASSTIMIERIGIIQWLNAILNTIEFHEFDVIEGIISILNNLWYAVQANAMEFENISHIQTNIHRLILRLLPNLSGRIDARYLGKYLNIMNKTVGRQYAAVSDVQLNNLIGCCQKHFGENLQDVINIKNNGYSGAVSRNDFCKSLHLAGIDTNTILAISSLREYVVGWSKWNSNQFKKEK